MKLEEIEEYINHKNKLEEGIYVRTKQGYIAKFKEYDEIFDVLRFETPIFLRSWVPCDYMQKERFMNRYFLKASHNIIDLIEVGDYLNGFKVSKIERYDTKTIIKIGNSTFNVLEGEEIYTPSYDNNNGYEKLEKLKSIVTKEQFENMKYSLGEE